MGECIIARRVGAENALAGQSYFYAALSGASVYIPRNKLTLNKTYVLFAPTVAANENGTTCGAIMITFWANPDAPMPSINRYATAKQYHTLLSAGHSLSGTTDIGVTGSGDTNNLIITVSDIDTCVAQGSKSVVIFEID